MLVKIGGVQKFSLLDFPDKISSIIFTSGCNFRCGYCHNPNLVTIVSSNSFFDETMVLDFLTKRIGKLDAVVVSGGEPTLQKDLKIFYKKVKALGFLTKLDTNGTNPNSIIELVESNLIDYIAMDIKSPIEKYSDIVCCNVDVEKIQKSIDYIMQCNIDYEFRTTVVKSQLDISDFDKIGQLLHGAKRYYLQKFVNKTTLNPNFRLEQTYSDEEFKVIKNILKKSVSQVFVR